MRLATLATLAILTGGCGAATKDQLDKATAMAATGAQPETTNNNGEKGDAGTKGDVGAKGDKGEKGDAGAQGLSGPKGDTGDRGLPGVDGKNGSAGAKGDAGATGSMGTTGASGSAGPKGDTGATGSVGATGATGVSGAVGATGSSGATGSAGSNGAAGATGSAGAAGQKGDKGDAGPSALLTMYDGNAAELGQLYGVNATTNEFYVAKDKMRMQFTRANGTFPNAYLVYAGLNCTGEARLVIMNGQFANTFVDGRTGNTFWKASGMNLGTFNYLSRVAASNSCANATNNVVSSWAVAVQTLDFAYPIVGADIEN